MKGTTIPALKVYRISLLAEPMKPGVARKGGDKESEAIAFSRNPPTRASDLGYQAKVNGGGVTGR